MAKGVKKQVFKKQNVLTSPQKDELSIEKNNAVNEGSNSHENISDNISTNEPLSIRFTNQNLIDAVIYSEILGKPKCKSRGRCR